MILQDLNSSSKLLIMGYHVDYKNRAWQILHVVQSKSLLQKHYSLAMIIVWMYGE